MHDLAELCEPGVTMIAIGDRNDIGLYRDLVQAGVSEYIVKPVTAQLFAQALSAALTLKEASATAGSGAKRLPLWVREAGSARQRSRPISRGISPIGRTAGYCSSTSICRVAIARSR